MYFFCISVDIKIIKIPFLFTILIVVCIYGFILSDTIRIDEVKRKDGPSTPGAKNLLQSFNEADEEQPIEHMPYNEQYVSGILYYYVDNISTFFLLHCVLYNTLCER